MRKCPFPWCKRAVREGAFSCYSHWVRMGKESHSRAMKLFRAHEAGTCTEAAYQRAVQKLVADNFALIDCEGVPGV